MINNEMKCNDIYLIILSSNVVLENKEFYKFKFDGSYYEASRPGSDIYQLVEPRANPFYFVN